METAGPGVGEASAEEYNAYETIVRAVSEGIAQGVKNSLDKLGSPQELTEMIAEVAGEGGFLEAAPDPGEAERIYDGFWNLWQGVDCDLVWRSRAGVPQKTALAVAEVRKAGTETASGGTGEEPEISFGINVGPIGFGVSW